VADDAGRPVALSIKQPWATLVVHGIKTIELRSWSTTRTGRVFIHTGRGAESADEAWEALPAHLQDFAELRGGIVGSVEVVGCRRYDDVASFAADAGKHLVPAAWLEKKPMFGFELANAEPLPFRPCKGALFFFPLPESSPEDD